MIHRYKNGNGKRQRKRRFSSMSGNIKIKALSINRAYSGRKRRSVYLKAFTREVFKQLEDGFVPDKGNLSLTITFGISNKANDLDNLLKCTIDCLQSYYEFNDKQIYYIQAYKKLVSKGNEYIDWKINKYHGNVEER